MYDFERARVPDGSRMNTGKSFRLSPIVSSHCANSIAGKCGMRTQGDCLLDDGSRCEYFEIAVIPLLVKKGGAEYEAVNKRYGKRQIENQLIGERVQELSQPSPVARICPTCQKKPLKPRERICHSCWRKNRNLRERERRKQAYGHLTQKTTL
jgi:hypothetical protein